jgi:F0F1-type ATP synthase assembly protein I
MSGKDRVQHSSPRPSAEQHSAEKPSAGEPATPRKRGWRTPSKPGGNEADGWMVVSYLIAGMLLYGGLGWLISRWTGLTAALLPIGMVVGLVIALVMVVLRYGRS